MSTVKRLFEYVEIKTKITSVFPFLMTLAYLCVLKRNLVFLNTAVFFFSMLLFDLTATAVNNYFDTKKNGLSLPFSRRAAFFIMLALFALSVLLGLYLFILTDALVLVLGALCFAFGVLYSYGPVPISHGPYGEVASGFFYGVLIPFLIAYINDPAWLLTFSVSKGRLIFALDLIPLLGLLLLCAVPFCLTANIMLANNICDVERDVAAKRYTLAYYLKRNALHLFALLYYIPYAAMIFTVVLRFLPPLYLGLLITLIPVQRNIGLFYKKQVKAETFIVSIKNFILVAAAQLALIALSGVAGV